MSFKVKSKKILKYKENDNKLCQTVPLYVYIYIYIQLSTVDICWGCHKLQEFYTRCRLLLSCSVQIGPVKTAIHVKVQMKFPNICTVFFRLVWNSAQGMSLNSLVKLNGGAGHVRIVGQQKSCHYMLLMYPSRIKSSSN